MSKPLYYWCSGPSTINRCEPVKEGLRVYYDPVGRELAFKAYAYANNGQATELQALSGRGEVVSLSGAATWHETTETAKEGYQRRVTQVHRGTALPEYHAEKDHTPATRDGKPVKVLTAGDMAARTAALAAAATARYVSDAKDVIASADQFLAWILGGGVPASDSNGGPPVDEAAQDTRPQEPESHVQDAPSPSAETEIQAANKFETRLVNCQWFAPLVAIRNEIKSQPQGVRTRLLEPYRLAQRRIVKDVIAHLTSAMDSGRVDELSADISSIALELAGMTDQSMSTTLQEALRAARARVTASQQPRLGRQTQEWTACLEQHLRTMPLAAVDAIAKDMGLPGPELCTGNQIMQLSLRLKKMLEGAAA